MKKLNLGSGKSIKSGFVNLDSMKLPGIDIVHDLNKYPWPIKKNEFDLVLCDNILEHLDGIIKPAEELWRITKPRGRIIIKVPIYPSIWAVSDPTHKSFYTFLTFNYFRPEDGLNYYSKARFRIIKRRIEFGRYTKIRNTGFMEWLVNLNSIFQKLYYTYLSFLIPASSLHFELEVVK